LTVLARPKADQTPSGHALSPAVAALLTEWSATKPILALMGEFSSGKSTLANFILGAPLLPENVTATLLPSVWLTYAHMPRSLGLREDGTLEHIELTDLGEDARSRFRLLRLEVPCERLRHMDMVDTPGLSDPSLAHDATQYLDPYIDGVVWCSSAIQAWRNSEKSAWTEFSERLQRHSLLVLSRADKVRTPKDLAKVLTRVRRETDGLFAGVLPLDTPLALATRATAATTPDTWDACGAAAFEAALDAAIETIAEEKQNATHSTELRGIGGQGGETQNTNAVLAAITGELQNSSIATIPQALTRLDHFQARIVDQTTLKPVCDASLKRRTEIGETGTTEGEEILQSTRADRTISDSVASLAHNNPNSKPPDDTPQTDQLPYDLQKQETPMSQTDISKLADISGFIGACLVDSETGLMMASEGGRDFDLEAASAANTEVVKAKLSAIEMLGLEDNIDDILITLGKQVHLIRPLEKTPTVFMYVALEKKGSNLGMARVQVKQVEKTVAM